MKKSSDTLYAYPSKHIEPFKQILLATLRSREEEVFCQTDILTNKYVALHLVWVAGEGQYDKQQVEQGLR